jgi:predicted RNase H-like HicB family nuclease
MKLSIDLDREEDGRWIAEIKQIPGVLAYGNDRHETIAKVKALALRAYADRLEHGEEVPEVVDDFLVAT